MAESEDRALMGTQREMEKEEKQVWKDERGRNDHDT